MRLDTGLQVHSVPRSERFLDILLLAMHDAHQLYRHHGGFEELPVPGEWMVRRDD